MLNQAKPSQAKSSQVKSSPTLLLLNLAQTKHHSTIAQLSPNQAPLYYCSTQFKPSPTLLLLNSAPVPVPVPLLQTSYNLAKFCHNLAKPQFSCNIDSAMLSQVKPSQVKSNQAPLYHCSNQPNPSPTLLLLNSARPSPTLLKLNSAQIKTHSTIAQLSSNQATLISISAAIQKKFCSNSVAIQPQFRPNLEQI